MPQGGKPFVADVKASVSSTRRDDRDSPLALAVLPLLRIAMAVLFLLVPLLLQQGSQFQCTSTGQLVGCTHPLKSSGIRLCHSGTHSVVFLHAQKASSYRWLFRCATLGYLTEMHLLLCCFLKLTLPFFLALKLALPALLQVHCVPLEDLLPLFCLNLQPCTTTQSTTAAVKWSPMINALFSR